MLPYTTYWTGYKEVKIYSPGSAGRRPGILPSVESTEEITAIPPCTWNSQQSSPVKLEGPVYRPAPIVAFSLKHVFSESVHMVSEIQTVMLTTLLQLWICYLLWLHLIINYLNVVAYLLLI